MRSRPRETPKCVGAPCENLHPVLPSHSHRVLLSCPPPCHSAFGLLLEDAGLPMHEWAGAYRSPYWDHVGGVVDWTGAASNFTVPAGRHLFVPVQWLLERTLISSCLPAPPLRTAGGKQLWRDGVDACRLQMHAGEVLQPDGPVCGCRASKAYRNLLGLRAPFIVGGGGSPLTRLGLQMPEDALRRRHVGGFALIPRCCWYLPASQATQFVFEGSG